MSYPEDRILKHTVPSADPYILLTFPSVIFPEYQSPLTTAVHLAVTVNLACQRDGAYSHHRSRLLDMSLRAFLD